MESIWTLGGTAKYWDVGVVGTNGGVVSDGDVLAAVGVADLSFSLAAIDVFHSLIASSSLAVKMEVEIPECGRNAENAEIYQKDGWDLASTYVLCPRPGINCPGFRMVRKKT